MIKFRIIENGDIFRSDFKDFTKNNIIDFPTNEEIVVIYGPNGTGKTSLIKVFAGAKDTKLHFEMDNKPYTSGFSVFHVINDQNNRNIIAGEMKDFFLGDDIKKEFELQKYLVEGRERIIAEIISKLKNNHGISAASSPLLSFISNRDIAEIVKDIVNSRSKGSKFSTEVLIKKFTSLQNVNITLSDEQQRKLTYLKSDYVDKNSVIQQIEQLSINTLKSNPSVHEIEENTEAINILNRFRKDQCIVCDSTDIDWQQLLVAKKHNRERIFQALDEDIKPLIERIISYVPANDPFNIKVKLIDAISNGDKTYMDDLVIDFKIIKCIYERLVINELSTIFNNSDLPEKMEEYQDLISKKPDITKEDQLYIKEIISNSMRKDLKLDRDENKNLRITLSNQEFLGKTRNELPLSAGEQNFLSLTFEFLKAKNSECPIVVIDDPISSFDSIYKNKVVFAIVKMLHHKKRIILTHNIDLLRLLSVQYKNCYNLYIMNNTNGEENGFIPLNKHEKEMLISIDKLLASLRGPILSHVIDKNAFLVSMVPFMRGYANIINNRKLTNKLTQLMHGYKNEKVDIAKVYIELFGNTNDIIPKSYEVSVIDILSMSLDNLIIIDNLQYPLLDKTLRHSFTYLYLRLLVEKKLVEKFNIDINNNYQLGQIINAAFPDENDIDQMRNRVKLTSKKTLMNEFNHFEGNLSIFQPAIDITDRDLKDERSDIIKFINKL